MNLDEPSAYAPTVTSSVFITVDVALAYTSPTESAFPLIYILTEADASPGTPL